MTDEILFESMEFINDSYLEKSEKKPAVWKKWTAVAASLCFVIAAVYLISVLSNTGQPPIYEDENDFPLDTPFENVNKDPNSQIEGPLVPDAPQPPDDYVPPVTPTDPDEPTVPVEDDKPVSPDVPALPNIPDEPELPEFLFEAVYNDVDSAISASRVNIPHYFTEELSVEELKSLELIVKEDWMNFSGFAGFDGDGNLLEVRMSTPTQVPDVEITVYASKVIPVIDYIFPDDAEVSKIENVDVKMYRWEISENKIILEADSVMDRANVHFSVTVTEENEASVRKDFETLIYLHAYWFNSERLDEIKAETIPEYRNEQTTLSEAYKDEDFGAYMPKNLPDGFTEESVRRYKNYQLNYLSGLWTNELAQIDWRISYMTEADENRRTSVETVENYDLSLYPIPMAQSVPDDLREIVNNPIFDIDELTLDVIYARSRLTEEAGDVSGYRTNFSVLCGDVLIEIRTKGVSPEWIYEELALLE